MRVIGRIKKFQTVTSIKTFNFQAHGNNMKKNANENKTNQEKRPYLTQIFILLSEAQKESHLLLLVILCSHIMKSHEEIFLYFEMFLFFLVKSQHQERGKYIFFNAMQDRLVLNIAFFGKAYLQQIFSCLLKQKYDNKRILVSHPHKINQFA